MTEERINTEDAPRIAERVKFWEEQDRINQELIPRVIRQNELLTGHIADHEERGRQQEAELAAAKAEREEQDRQYQTALATLQGQTLKVRNLVIGVSAGAAVISGVAIVVAVLTYVGGTP